MNTLIVYCIPRKFGGLASTSVNKNIGGFLIWRMTRINLDMPMRLALAHALSLNY